MTKKKNAPDNQASPLRIPKPKQKLGLKVPQIQMPHLELVHPEIKPEEYDSVNKPEILPADMESLPSQTRQTRQTRQTTRKVEQQAKTPVAPMRDFQKVPNSITKSAIPEGVFKPGKSKMLYDVLYGLTRGAIEPKRTIRLSKTKLMKLAAIGSRITFDSIISQFEATGLVKVTVFAGEHEGNEFEVFTPDELLSQTSQTSLTSLTSHAQFLDRVLCLETSQTSQSLNVANTGSSENSNTFFKTLRQSDDDAPLVLAFAKLNEAALAATGKDLTQKDWEAFLEIIELLIDETTIARTRTKSISVYLKFAAENLRRRLFKKNQSSPEKAKPFEPGKIENAPVEVEEEFVAEPLGKKREVVLENLRRTAEMNGPEAIEIYRENFTPEDWAWLLKELSGKQPSRILPEQGSEKQK